MELRRYWLSMPVPERQALADRCGYSFAHIRNVVYRQKRCAAELAINLERESRGAVQCEELRPDVDWAYLRKRRC